MTLLHDIRYMWDIIGEQLSVSDDHIMSAQNDVPNDCTRKLSKILQVWIEQRTSQMTWKKIITVVEDKPLENKEVVKKIFHFLERPKTQKMYLSSYQLGKFKMNLFSNCFCIIL